jgi:hypothetical protein
MKLSIQETSEAFIEAKENSKSIDTNFIFNELKINTPTHMVAYAIEIDNLEQLKALFESEDIESKVEYEKIEHGCYAGIELPYNKNIIPLSNINSNTFIKGEYKLYSIVVDFEEIINLFVSHDYHIQTESLDEGGVCYDIDKEDVFEMFNKIFPEVMISHDFDGDYSVGFITH